LGRLHPLKRLDLLAAAFVRVREALPNAQLLVVGPDEAGHRAELASHFAPLGAHAHFLGEADAAGKAALFAAGWVSATTSDSESFGQSVAEALAAGVPAVVVDTCPWRQLESERCGRWVKQTPAAVAEGLLEFLSDDNRRRQAGDRARRFARREFAWDAVAERMKSAYARFAAPARSRLE
jgi:glycosyltransferase involved in cell wall biosynthesis